MSSGPMAYVLVTENKDGSGAASGLLLMHEGDTIIEVIVTAEDPNYTKLYTLTVHRISANALLQSVTLRGLNAGGTAVWSPAAWLPNSANTFSASVAPSVTHFTFQPAQQYALASTVWAFPLPASTAVAIGAGSLFLSHVNDAGFWLVKEYFGMTVGQTIKSWSVMETIISVVGLLCVLLLSVFV